MLLRWVDLTVRAIIIIVVFVICIGVCVGTVVAWRTGHIDGWIPKPREVEQVKINLYGPAMTIRGTTADFYAEVIGKGGIPKWDLICPPGIDGRLRVSPDGKRAEFMSLDEGDFKIYVAVGGEAMQRDSYHLSFENLNLIQQSELQRQQDQQAQQQQSQAMAMQEPPKPRVPELTMGALSRIESEDKTGEARAIAGCIRGVITQIQSGMGITPDSDPAIMIAQRVESQLQERTRAWDFFLISIGVILKGERDDGRVTSLPTAIPALNEIANVLHHTQ